MEKSRNAFHYMGGCASMSVLAVCAFFTVSAVIDLMMGTGTGTTSPGVLFGLAIFFGCGVITALYGVYFSMFRKRGKTSNQFGERLVLGVAKACKGIVSVEEIALQTKLSIDQSQSILDELADKGVARRDVNPQGGMVYLFSGFGGVEADIPSEIELEFEALEREEAAQEQVQFEKIEH